jgi:sugar lactone lactonase YvrE
VPETVADFYTQMPTGVTVSQAGRVFVNYPRWGDPVEFTVAEIVNGAAVSYPNREINRLDPTRPADTLVSVQSVVVDPRDRLWLVDTGSIERNPVLPGGPKLVGIDLQQNQIAKTIAFPPDVALPTTYLNDVRFDLRRGAAGMAFLTDSSAQGPNGIVVVDLDSGSSWRRLHDHPSTKAEPAFVPIVEGEPLMVRPLDAPPSYLSTGSDGIAISADGERLYYTPLASRHLYSVSVSALIDPAASDDAVAATVVDHGERAGASDGLESDAQGRVYVTDYEHQAIRRLLPDGTYETVVADPRLRWPDTLALARDGYLYVTANQLHLQPLYQGGQDRRQPPYQLFRLRTDAAPVALR